MFKRAQINSRVAQRPAVLFVVVAGLALAACAKKEERVFFNGNYYPAKSKEVSKSERRTFNVSVRRIDQGLDGARAAGLHEGKRYCLKNYGTSEIEWIVGPETPQQQLDLSSGNLRLQGSCVLW